MLLLPSLIFSGISIMVLDIGGSEFSDNDFAKDFFYPPLTQAHSITYGLRNWNSSVLRALSHHQLLW